MTPTSVPPERAPWYRRFQGLMPFRVHEILLVSSEYDAFVLEEDGPLTERLYSGYSELDLSAAPRITHARSVGDARRLLAERRFEMVMTVVGVEDGDARDVARAVRRLCSDAAVILLVFDEGELGRFGGAAPEGIDQVFCWSGDARTLLAAIKIVEDARNVAPDTRAAGVQVILVVEDSPRAWSRFLGRLYPELMRQSHSLIAEGGNPLHRRLRMRARPRILMAHDYESAIELAAHYRRHLLALITDVRFPRAGVVDEAAGLALVDALRDDSPDLPVMLLTSEQDLEKTAERLGASLVQKGSSAVPTVLRDFLRFWLGFGDFVFRTERGEEVGRAASVYEMERALATVPDVSLRYHAAHHHFSIWLRARGMFDLASQIRPRTVDEFDDLEAMREFLVDVVGRAREREQTGTISDVDALPTHSPENRFVRVGSGSIGGKGRGLAFVNHLIARDDLLNRFDGLQIRIPKTVVLGADEFERFRAWEQYEATSEEPDAAHVARSLAEPLSPATAAQLRLAVSALSGPLAIRSSSVLEDARFRPFAGVYKTYLLPNDAPTFEARFRQIEDAVRAVFASVFMRAARTYLAGTPHALEDQRMGVVIQQVVGVRYGERRFYPVISGVAQSYDYYPMAGRRPEDGVVHLALGLGHQVVGGGATVRVCPAAPDARIEVASAREALAASQSCFYAVDLTEGEVDLVTEPRAALVKLPLRAAREDGVLGHVASTYDVQADVLRDSPRAKGSPVVTMASVLRYGAYPLIPAIRELLVRLRDGFGSEVEIELAVDAPGWLPDGTRRAPRLYVLQVRPLPVRWSGRVSLETLPDEPHVVRSERALGDGEERIEDVIYVRTDTLTPRESERAAAEVAEMVRAAEGAFALIGPGRWGTSDAHLGVPVRWRDIAGVRALVELPMGDRHVEPSQGSHFFRNLVGDRVAYFAVGAEGEAWDPTLLDALPAVAETDRVRHVRGAFRAIVDGRRGRGVLVEDRRDGA